MPTCSALALRQISFRNIVAVVAKESTAGCVMGATLGTAVLLLGTTTHAVSPEVGVVVGLALPVVSLWSNGLGAGLTMTSAKMGLDPAMTSAPLVTTIVDTTGLVIYFMMAKSLMANNLLASLLTGTTTVATISP